MAPDLGRRLVAETIGTTLLVVFGAGSVVAALTLGNGELNYAGLGMIALAFGLVVAIVIYAFGTTSGAHINPAVSFSLALRGRFPWPEVPPYVVAQLLGAVVGGLLIVAVFGKADAVRAGVGLTKLGDGVSHGSGFVAEVLGTFLLVGTIMALAVDRRAPAGWAGLMIGLAVTCEILLVGPVSGGSVNPARTFGPYLISEIFGGSTPWGQLWVYWAGPLVGGGLAAVVYDLVARPDRAEVAEASRQGTEGEIEGRQTVDVR
jgi:glycerol uptake facilitator protein